MTVELQTPSEIVEDRFSGNNKLWVLAMAHGRKGFRLNGDGILRDISIVLARYESPVGVVWEVWQLDRTDPSTLISRPLGTYAETQAGWCPPRAWKRFTQLAAEIVRA